MRNRSDHATEYINEQLVAYPNEMTNNEQPPSYSEVMTRQNELSLPVNQSAVLNA